MAQEYARRVVSLLLGAPLGVNGVALVEKVDFLPPMPGSCAGVNEGESTFKAFFELMIRLLLATMFNARER